MSTEIVMFGDIVEKNGKTIRENNLAKPHLLSAGQQVRLLKYDDEKDEFTRDGLGGGIAFILHCGRDCDGTVLYYLGGQAAWHEIERLGFEQTFDNMVWRIFNCVQGGFPEDSVEPSDFVADVRAVLEQPK